MRKFITVILLILTTIFSAPPIFSASPQPESSPSSDIQVIDKSQNPDKNISISPPSQVYPPSYTPGIYLLVSFDKKGSALAAGEIVFDEMDKDLLKNFTFLIPEKDINLIRTVQQKLTLKKQCPPDKQPQYDKSTRTTVYPPECYDTYVSLFTTLEPKVEKTEEGLRVTVTAKPNLAEKTQESIIFSYRTSSYTKKSFSNYPFTLSSPRIPITAATVQIGIITKEDLFLRGSTLTNNYTYIPNFRALEKARNLKEEENNDLYTFAGDIMYQGYIRKSDSDLAPDTSFIVRGIYGSVWPLLYLKEFSIFMAVIISIFLGVFAILKIFFRKSPHLKIIVISLIIGFVIFMLIGILIVLSLLFFRMQGVPLYK